MQVETDLANHARYLRVSMYVTQFFSDGDKLLLTDRPTDELDLLDDLHGKPLSPGEVYGTLPPGTRLRIERIEFPSGLVVAGRLPYSPRYNPWVYLVPAEPGPAQDLAKNRRYILVLRPQLRTRTEVLAEVDRYLTQDDVKGLLALAPPDVQDAIRKKSLVTGMTPEQVEMAWGYPERIHIDEVKKTQVWDWPEKLQQAVFQGKTLSGWRDHGAAGGNEAVP